MRFPPNLKLAMLIVYLLNYKNSIGAWHIRVLWSLIKNSLRHKLKNPKQASDLTQDIFCVYNMKQRASLADLDFNLHKSNSTSACILIFLTARYFSDADIARTDFVLQHFAAYFVGNTTDKLMLANVACNFAKEIKPYEQFTMSTRLLCWTEKWLYICTSFSGSTLEDKRAICIAQYVVKRNRRTIKPDQGTFPRFRH